MPHVAFPLRRWLVCWLYAVASGHLLVSLLLTWAGPSGMFNGYLSALEHATWASTVPGADRAQQLWWLALFGATLQSYSLYMLALVHLGHRLKSASVWAWLIAGVLLWAPQDMLISAQAKVWSHLWLDALALLVLLPPLLWLYRHDRNAQPAAVLKDATDA